MLLYIRSVKILRWLASFWLNEVLQQSHMWTSSFELVVIHKIWPLQHPINPGELLSAIYTAFQTACHKKNWARWILLAALYCTNHKHAIVDIRLVELKSQDTRCLFSSDNLPKYCGKNMRNSKKKEESTPTWKYGDRKVLSTQTRQPYREEKVESVSCDTVYM